MIILYLRAGKCNSHFLYKTHINAARQVTHINKLTQILDICIFSFFLNNTFQKMVVLVSGETMAPAILSQLHGVNICLDFVIHVCKF